MTFQVFDFYWRHWYSKFTTGFGALALFASDFDVMTVGRNFKNFDSLLDKYFTFCDALATLGVSESPDIKPVILPVIPPVFSPPSDNKILAQAASGSAKSASLIPDRSSLISIKTEIPDLVVPVPNTKPLFRPPDQTCHKRAFSSSVIRIPYLTFDRVVDDFISASGSVFKSQRPSQHMVLTPTIIKSKKRKVSKIAPDPQW